MYFEWCFGTFVPSFGEAGIVAGQEPPKHEDDHTPHTRRTAIIPACKNTSLATCVREASAAPAAYLNGVVGNWTTPVPFGGSFSPNVRLRGDHSREPHSRCRSLPLKPDISEGASLSLMSFTRSTSMRKKTGTLPAPTKILGRVAIGWTGLDEADHSSRSTST